MGRVAADDIVRSASDARPGGRPPLLVLDPLQSFLDAHRLGSGPLRPEPIGEGHSNVTYLIRRDDAELVLRRPPRPPLPPSTHDVLREARLLRALEGTRVRVPRVLAVGEDEHVIGSPFYVMALVEGEVIGSTLPVALDQPSQRRLIGEELIDALAEIHEIDWQSVGLDGFGRPTGYLERQLRRFSGLWELTSTRSVPAVERVGRWLAEHLPDVAAASETTLVHGDYRLGNMLFAPAAPARLSAVLDWEMATIGDPLADLGYLCTMWVQAQDPDGGLREHLGRITRAPGFHTRAELVARYEQRTGRVAHNLGWYQALAAWKAAVFMEGNYRRALDELADEQHTRRVGAAVLELAGWAEDLARA